MVIKKELVQHYRAQEVDFVDKVTDIIRQVEETYTFYLTDFINPRQAEICRHFANQAGLLFFDSKAYYKTEYSRVIIAPEYYSLVEEDFELDVIELTYNTKFNHVTHSQVLGSLIHQLGIERTVLGDILVSNEVIQIVASHSMSDYILQSIQKINRVPVKLRKVHPSQIVQNVEDYKAIDCLVSSLRLDKIIAVVLKLSRASASKLIEHDKVKLNYTPVSKSSEEVEVGDLVSVRGYGRFIISEHNGYSKSGKQKLLIKKLVHK